MIPFSIEEKVFVARTDLVETFEDVLQIAQDVYEFQGTKKVGQTEQQTLPQGSSEDNQEDSEDQTESLTFKPEQGEGEGEEDNELNGSSATEDGEEELEDEDLDYDDQTTGGAGAVSYTHLRAHET